MPIARLDADSSATKASPLNFLLPLNFKIKNDAMTTTGVANQSGARLSTVAIAKAPNAV